LERTIHINEMLYRCKGHQVNNLHMSHGSQISFSWRALLSPGTFTPSSTQKKKNLVAILSIQQRVSSLPDVFEGRDWWHLSPFTCVSSADASSSLAGLQRFDFNTLEMWAAGWVKLSSKVGEHIIRSLTRFHI
jgi:hypothetical protein